MSLSIKNKYITKRLHRLVAKTFIPNPKNYPVINHIDGNKINNCINNMEWCTQKQNAIHSWKNGLTYKTKNQIETTRRKTKKKVLQYSKDNKLIKKWNGVIDASKELGICKSNISMCAKGRYKTAGNFIWRYVED